LGEIVGKVQNFEFQELLTSSCCFILNLARFLRFLNFFQKSAFRLHLSSWLASGVVLALQLLSDSKNFQLSPFHGFLPLGVAMAVAF